MPEDKDTNPIQKRYEDTFDGLRRSESEGTVDNDLSKKTGDESAVDSVKNAEETPESSWTNNVTGNSAGRGKGRGKGFLKKKGPITAIILTLLGGGIGITGLLGGGILPVHMAEVLTEKFNAQLASMDVRTTKNLAKKMGTTSGLCNGVLTVKCRFSTMSEKQIKKFEKAGIKVNYDPKVQPTLLGRTKPTSFEFKGETISAKDFNKFIKSSPEFRSALKKAYSPKYVGFADAIWEKVAARLKISKGKIDLDGKTDEDRMKKIQDQTKDPKSELGEDDLKSTDGKTKDEINQEKIAREQAENLAKNSDEIASSGIKSAGKVLKQFGTSAINSLKVTGLADDACSVYGAMKAVGYAAKTVRALQLARYAMIFLNVASQIKAGEAKAEDVSYIGKILTTEVVGKDENGETTRKTATDSFGYKFAAYGERGQMSDSASQYLAGGGLTGKLIIVSGLINKILGGSPNTTCKILNNPFVQGGSLIGGIALWLIPGGQAPMTAKEVGQIAFSTAVSVALLYLPAMLQDIIAGVLVDETTVGENAGDAIVSGASGMMGSVAAGGGNAPLTPSQAIAYNGLSNEIAAQYIEEERLSINMFDASNKNSFLGSMLFNLTPYLMSTSSVAGTLNSLASLPLKSLSLLSPITKAASVEDYKMCQDFDYKELGLATDPYCNVSYGIPPENLDIDPIEVVDYMVSNNQIDEETGEAISGSSYETFLTSCVDRQLPLGDTGQDFSTPSGEDCIFGKKKEYEYYYLYFIDKRVNDSMDDEEETSSDTSSADASAYDGKTAKELAKIILDSGNVTDRTGQLKQVKSGSRTNINIKVLKVLAGLSKDYKFTISELVRAKGADYSSKTSQHYVGEAVDFSGRVGINGIPIPNYSDYNETIQSFINDASNLLGKDCNQIGVPNNKYVKNTDSKCDVIVDHGTGTHIHIGIKP